MTPSDRNKEILTEVAIHLSRQSIFIKNIKLQREIIARTWKYQKHIKCSELLFIGEQLTSSIYAEKTINNAKLN
jgi:hypothetical protein